MTIASKIRSIRVLQASFRLTCEDATNFSNLHNERLRLKWIVGMVGGFAVHGNAFSSSLFYFEGVEWEGVMGLSLLKVFPDLEKGAMLFSMPSFSRESCGKPYGFIPFTTASKAHQLDQISKYSLPSCRLHLG